LKEEATMARGALAHQGGVLTMAIKEWEQHKNLKYIFFKGFLFLLSFFPISITRKFGFYNSCLQLEFNCI